MEYELTKEELKEIGADKHINKGIVIKKDRCGKYQAYRDIYIVDGHKVTVDIDKALLELLPEPKIRRLSEGAFHIQMYNYRNHDISKDIKESILEKIDKRAFTIIDTPLPGLQIAYPKNDLKLPESDLKEV